MTRSTSVLLLLIAAFLAYLSYVDRMSTLAITVVEWDHKLGVPLNAIVGAIGTIGFALSFRNLLRKPAVTRYSPRTAPPAASATDWRRRVHENAAALPLEPGAHISHDQAGVALTLTLSRVPQERARRAIDSFCTFVAGIPAPPRVRIRFIDCPDTGLPRHQLVNGIARRHLGEELHVTAVDDAVDIRFHHPDPRW